MRDVRRKIGQATKVHNIRNAKYFRNKIIPLEDKDQRHRENSEWDYADLEENLALKKSFRTGLATKEEELRILRSLTEQQQAAYENAMTHMRKQVKQTAGQAQAKVIQTESKNDSNIMTQLQADNDYLRKQLKSTKDKLKEFQLRSKIRKSEFFDEKSRSAANELRRHKRK